MPASIKTLVGLIILLTTLGLLVYYLVIPALVLMIVTDLTAQMVDLIEILNGASR